MKREANNSRQFIVDGARIEIENAPELRFPSDADCNTPCWWGRDGQLHALTSTGHPRHSSGPDITRLVKGDEVSFTAWRDGGRWIESLHQEADGTLFGWYHNEPAHYIPDEYQRGRQFPMTAPFIGAAVSRDDGLTWDDLGLVLAGSDASLNIEHRNEWFAGGNGDCSVILDRQGEYFYILFGSYYKDTSQQGIALARLRFADRACPVGKVMKWHEGGWQQPGLGGAVTPVFSVQADWYSPRPDAFWGPSVHWNTALQKYVILMNRAIDPNWKQGGIYISLSEDIGDPGSWSAPLKILDEDGWYPQVIGRDDGKRETEREAGQRARLFIHGVSNYVMRFSKD